MHARRYLLVAPALLAVGVAGVAGAQGAGSPHGAATTSVAARSARPPGVVAAVTLDPVSVGLRLQPATLQVGQPAVATVSVLDHSTTALAGAVAVVLAPVGVRVTPPAVKAIGTVAAGAAVSVTWTLCATVPGTYRISAVVLAGNASGEFVVGYAPSSVLTVTKGLHRC